MASSCSQFTPVEGSKQHTLTAIEVEEVTHARLLVGWLVDFSQGFKGVNWPDPHLILAVKSQKTCFVAVSPMRIEIERFNMAKVKVADFSWQFLLNELR